MFRAFEIGLTDIIQRPDKFEPTKYGEYEKTTKVEIVKSDEHDIPRLHFTWVPEFHLYGLDQEAMEKLTAAGFPCEKREQNPGDTGPVRYACFVKGKDERHLWFMNFRRYSWSWTSEKEGSYGYTGGHVYANGNAIAFLAQTPQDVVRDALIVSWATLKNSGRLPPAFFCREVEATLPWLLHDALLHISDHARPSHNSGPAVSWLPAMRVNLPNQKLEQPPRKTVYEWGKPDANVSIFETGLPAFVTALTT